MKEAHSNISYNESDANFDELFKNRPLKFVGVSLACVLMPIVLCLCYGIIWFERFGSGNYISYLGYSSFQVGLLFSTGLLTIIVPSFT